MDFQSLMFTVHILALNADGRTYVDLTHTLDNNAPKWPLPGILTEDKYFKKTDLLWTRTPNYWAALSYMEFYEHLGTHIDAPIHAAEGKPTVDQIPVRKLIGPFVVFDIKEKVLQDPDYGLTVADIGEHESEFGRIPNGAIVTLNSGWGLKYPNPEQIFGTNDPKNATTFRFPGYTVDAAKFLFIQRKVNIIGTDTPSIDVGSASTFPVHAYLLAHEVPLMEYIANLDAIPQTGATIFLGAPKFRGGTGGPTRVVAILDDDVIVSSFNDSKDEVTCIILACAIVQIFRILALS